MTVMSKALVGVALLAPLFLSGCIPLCVMVPGTDCSENPSLFGGGGGGGGGGGRRECDYVHDVEEAEETPRGWAALYHSTLYCNGEGVDDEWRVVGFTRGEPEDFRVSSDVEGSEHPCPSCPLRIPVEHDLADLDVRFSPPFWMRISARLDSTAQRSRAQTWYYVASTTRSGEVTGTARCKEKISEGKAPSMMSCLGPIGEGRWEAMVGELGDPTLFDEQALAWIAAHRDDPAEVVDGLSYFANTWEAAAGRRTGETIESLHQLVAAVGCLPGLDADAKGQYLDALEVILGPLQQDEILANCPGRIEAIDAELLARVRADLTPSFLQWEERIGMDPPPSDELVEQLDRMLIANFSTDGIWRDARTTFYTRMARLEALPMSQENLARLQEALVDRIEMLAVEAMATLKRIDDPVERRAFLERLDERVARDFPAGTEFFLMRIDDERLPRPKPAAVKAILDRARAMKAKGAPFDRKECEVVRRLSLLPVGEGRCVLPDEL